MKREKTLRRAASLIERGEYLKASSEISQIGSTVDSLSISMYMEALILKNHGEYDTAESFCVEAIESGEIDSQTLFRLYHLLASIEITRGNFNSAISILKSADRVRPDDRYDSVILHEKASVFLMLGEFSESIKLFRRAIRLNEKKPPDLGQIRLRRNKRGLAQALAYSGDVKAGLDLVRSIDQPEDQKPSLAYQHLITGELLLLDHQPEEALRHIVRGCEIIDEMSALGMGAACRRLRAECLLALGRHDEAKMEAQAAYSWSYKLTERHEMGRELLILADIAAAEGKYRSAERKHFRAAQILEKIGSSWVLVHYHKRKVG